MPGLVYATLIILLYKPRPGMPFWSDLYDHSSWEIIHLVKNNYKPGQSIPRNKGNSPVSISSCTLFDSEIHDQNVLNACFRPHLPDPRSGSILSATKAGPIIVPKWGLSEKPINYRGNIGTTYLKSLGRSNELEALIQINSAIYRSRRHSAFDFNNCLSDSTLKCVKLAKNCNHWY